MATPFDNPQHAFKFGLKHMAVVVVVLSVCCAVFPFVGLCIAVATPSAVGFILLAIGGQRQCEWLMALGFVLMPVGLIVSGLIIGGMLPGASR